MDLKKYITDVPDFPKPGILFKDITPLLLDPTALGYAMDRLVALVPPGGVDKVVGMESRGFLMGVGLAERLEAGFVPVRKPGKLPRETVHASYELEYGEDMLELHSDAIRPGERVLIHDDILATGGTAAAVKKMVSALGGTIVGFNFLVHLGFLEGEKRLGTTPCSALIVY